MDDAKGIKHSAECERTQFIQELKTLKQRASQLRCQIGEMVLVSERMEMEEKRCGQLKRRLESCDTRVVELEEKLWTKTQEVEVARETYRLLRKDLAQFNQNLVNSSDETSCSAIMRKKKSSMKSGGKRRRKEKEEEEADGKASLFQRSSDCYPCPQPSSSSVRTGAGQRTDLRTVLSAKQDVSSDHNRLMDGEGGSWRKREDALSQQPKTCDEETVKAKRRKKSDKKRERGAGKEEREDRHLHDRTESTSAQRGREEGGGGRGGGGAGGGEGLEGDCGEEDVEKTERNLSLRKCSSYVITNDSSSMFKSCVATTQSTSAVTSAKKKTSCLPSIRISEVHPRGKYIRIINASQSQEEDLGNHFLLQRYQDTPFTVFRFPSSVRLPPQGVATVWSASGAAEECCAGRQLPPTDFIFSSQPIWASGPDCITILCKPNEQALKWLSSSPSLAKRSEESPSGGFGPSSLKKHKSLQQPQQQQKTKSYVVYNAGLEEQSSAFKDVDPVKECQSKAASGAKDEIRREEKKSARGEERRRPQVDCSQTSDSSPDRRRTLTLVERKRGVAAADEEDVERRRRTGEARKRKKKSVKVDSRKEKEAEAEAEVEEEECPGCGEEIRRRRKKSEQAKEKEEEKEEEEKRTKNRGDKEEDFWKVTTIMDRKIPCTIVHIEDQPTTSPTVAATRRKSKDRGKEGKGGKEGGGGKGKGGGGRGECDEERSECGEERDCGETNRPNSIGNNFNSLINSKNSICAMSDSNQDDNDCCDRGGGGGGGGGGCGSESPRQKKRLSDGSLGRCIESRDGSSKGGSSCCTMKECKDRKEARNGVGRGEGSGRQGGGGRAREDGCCEAEEEDDEDEDDCDRKRKERKVIPCRKSKCDECMDSKSRKKEEDEAVQEKWNRPNACGGKGGCGGGGRGKEGGKGGGGSGGGGGKRRTSKECKDDEECCESGEESNWTKWTKWLAGLVNSRRSSSSPKGGDSGHRGDQPPSTVDCLDDQMRSVGDTEVRCIDQVHVRERCPTYRPRLAKGAQCRCPDGCPACPPRKPDCSEEVGIMERSRQRTMKTKKMQSADDCDCDGSAQRRQQKRDATKCDYDEEGGGGSPRISRSDGCLREGGGSQLDSMALTAASVMAAGLTVAAIYCH